MTPVRWIACAETDIPVGDDWLVPAEQRRLARYTFTKRRVEYLVRRLAGKTAVATALGLPLDPAYRSRTLGRIGMLNRMGGAPYAELDGRPAPFDISLTDRSGHAVALLGDEGTMESGSLGVDLEIVEPRSEGFVRDYLTAPEQAWVYAERERAGEDGWEFGANLIWSAKEAALKVLRVGLRADTRTVIVHVDSAVRPDGWAPLVMETVRGEVFPGWWRRDGIFLLTIATREPVPPPAPLPGSETLATAQPIVSWLANPKHDA